MSELKVYTGPLQSYYYFSEQIIKSIQNKNNDFLIILPVNRAVRLFKRMLIDSTREKVLVNPPIFTFDELLLRLYRIIPGARRIISTETLHLFIETILNDQINKLKYFSSGSVAAESLVKKTTEIISELRRFGYNNLEFKNLHLEEKSVIPLKYENFNILLSALDDKFGADLIDEPFALHTVANQFTKEQFISQFPDVRNIYISGYGLFTPAMFTFIEKIYAWYNVHIKLEYQTNNSNLFSHTNAAYERFISMGANIIEYESQDNLSNQLFNRQLTELKKCYQVNRINVQGLKHREEEIEFIAWQIRKLYMEKGISLHKIAVTFSNLERYVPLIRQKFKDFQIPFNLSTGIGLNQSPLIRTYLNCLSLIDGGFVFNDVLQFFNNTFVKTPDEWNPNLLKELFIQNRVRFLSEKKLDQLYKQLQGNVRSNDVKYYDILHQLKLIKNLLQPLFNFPTKEDTTGLRSAYVKLLNKLNLLTWYQVENSLMSEREKENEFRAFNRYMKLLDKFVWTLNYLQGPNEITLKYFLHCLQSIVNQTTYNLTELPDYGVQIMPRLEILAVDFDILFVGGLIDGDFPRAMVKDVFFSDAVREEMNLLASEELLNQDRFIFYSLLDTSADKIFLTYPKYQDDRALTPSTFLADLNDVAELSFNENVDENELLNAKKHEVNFGLEIQKTNPDKAKLIATDIFYPENREDTTWVLDKIQSAWRRIISGRFSALEGNLNAVTEIKEILKKEYINRSWSVTQLEEYAFCPMQFFLNRILKIKDESEFEEGINNLERGNIIHDILYQFFTELKKLNKLKYPAEYKDLLLSIANNIFNQMPFSGFFWDLERTIYFGTENNVGLVTTFLDYDQEQIAETGFTPDKFEFAFGYTFGSQKDQTSSKYPVTLKNNFGQIKINGKIDRIDQNQKGETLIFDYKTGVQASSFQAREFLAGTRFQLPLYILAFNKINNDSEAVYGGYYLVKDEENCIRKHILADKSKIQFIKATSQAALPNKKIISDEGEELSFKELLDYSLTIAIQKTNELQQGIFRHTKYPDDIICQQYCEFRRMCQKNVGKLRRG